MIASGTALEALQFRAPAVAGRPPALPLFALAVVAALHWGALVILRGAPQRPTPAAPSSTVEVVFLPRTEASAADLLRPPPWPQPPRPVTRPRRALQALPVSPSTPVDDPAVPEETAERPSLLPHLFDPDGTPRLPDISASGPSRHADARDFGRRAPQLPGSDAPVIDIGEFRAPPTPEQRVMRIASFIGLGRPPTDSCRQVERRLASETDALTRQITLDTFNKRCRGWR